ncbi:helix-turn-helix transcriptional regulator [Streptomyces sp. NPDC046862]|uniref:helix-turn-helix transcriptional regulator n=1 Tax=Streptomyces sp. NPDC046862 TaxID=3154603 RepID=UPI00345366A0
MTIFPPDPDFEALRLELARLRAAKGWTYDELAARSGLARRTLIEIEQGRTIGTLETWHALAHALSTPLDELFATLCNGHEPPRRPTADSPGTAITNRPNR